MLVSDVDRLRRHLPCTMLQFLIVYDLREQFCCDELRLVPKYNIDRSVWHLSRPLSNCSVDCVPGHVPQLRLLRNLLNLRELPGSVMRMVPIHVIERHLQLRTGTV